MWLTELLDFRGWIWENSAEDVPTAIKLPRVARSFRSVIEDQASSLVCLHPSSCPKAFRFVRNLSLSLSARSRLQICRGSPVETHFFFTATIFFSQTFLRSLTRQLSYCRVILCSRVPQREVLAHGHTVEDFSFWWADSRLSLDVWSLSWSKTIIDCFRPDLTELFSSFFVARDIILFSLALSCLQIFRVSDLILLNRYECVFFF